METSNDATFPPMIDAINLAARPLVSIIVPAYNYGHFIAENLTSIRNQTLGDFECIVVDDGSTDQTCEIVSTFCSSDSRFKYIYQTNQGQPAARNHGLLWSKGRFIQFLDADDIIESSKLSGQSNYLLNNPEASVVYGNICYFTSDQPGIYFKNRWGGRDQEWMKKISGKGNELIAAFASDNLFELGSALFRREAIDYSRGFDCSLQGVEDYDLCFRLSLGMHQFSYVDAPGTAVLMRHHSGSFSKSLIKMYWQELKLRKKIAPMLKQFANGESIMMNSQRFSSRLRQLQHLLIDLCRKGRLPQDQSDLLLWILKSSPTSGSLYFFPRWTKAVIERRVRRVLANRND